MVPLESSRPLSRFQGSSELLGTVVRAQPQIALSIGHLVVLVLERRLTVEQPTTIPRSITWRKKLSHCVLLVGYRRL